MSGLVRANNSGQSGIASNIETIDSDDYVDVSIDTAHIGNDQVTGAKLNPSLVLGDIIYADGTDTIARLAKGSEDEVLTMGGSNAPTWAAASAGTDISVHVRNSADQSIANNAMTALLFNTDSGAANTYDTDTMHATDSGRLVATTPGKYIITGHIRWASNNTGRRIIEIRYNGAEIAQIEDSACTTGAHEQGITTALEMAEDDYVELKVLQSSGDALNSVANSNHIPDFMMNKVLG